MKMLLTGLVALTSVPIWIHGVSITSVSAPQESQDFGNNDGYAARDNIWTSHPVDTRVGIGHLVDTSPSILAMDINFSTRFGVLHSHKYAAPYMPVSSAVVTYIFDQSTVVSALEILQHANGVTRIEGFVGDDLFSMTSIGNTFGTAGDVTGRELFAEGESHVFNFDNSRSGTIFQFAITQTSLADGYAMHRAFPLDLSGNRIIPAPDRSSTLPLLATALIGMAMLRRRVA
jgi:hypothetical protein